MSKNRNQLKQQARPFFYPVVWHLLCKRRTLCIAGMPFFVPTMHSCLHQHKTGVMAPFKVGNNHGAVCATPLKTTVQHQHDEDMVKTVKKSKKKAKHPEVVAQQIIKRPAPYSEPELCTTDDDFQDRLPVVANPATPRKKTRITVADVHDICHAQTIHLTGMIGRLEDKLDQLLESNFAPAGGTTAPVDSSAVKAAPKEKKEKLPPVSYALFTKHARPSAVKLIEDSGHKASMGCIRLPKILKTKSSPAAAGRDNADSHVVTAR